MKVSDYIAKFFEEKGSYYIFGYIGGAITHLVDSISKNKNLKFIQVYHEQTASFAAEGYSRNGEGVGIAIATSGPGATNLITGIADAFFDSIPVIILTGQVNTYEYKYQKPVRQQGFQETDIISIVKPITKYAVLIDNKDSIKYELEKAFFIAKNGRPGPVLIDIPMDIQRSDVDEINLKSYFPDENQPILHNIDYNKIEEYLSYSTRPVILAGGGVQSGNAQDALLRFSKLFNIPVVVSLMGKGTFPEDNDSFIGMIGSYGNRCANIILSNSDLIFAIGTRLDTRQTGTRLDSFASRAKIIHVDIDEYEVTHNRIKRDYSIAIDSKVFIEGLIKNIQSSPDKYKDWHDFIYKIKEQYNQKKEVYRNVENKAPYILMDMLSKFSTDNTVFCVDIGQNQMFAAQSLIIKREQCFYTSGGMAPMGYAIPLGIGVSFSAIHSKNIIAITGDGGFHISTQSLMLLSQYNLPIKVIVLNNKSLGMIVQFQDLYFDNNEVGTTETGGYYVPNIKDIAAAYNIQYQSLEASQIEQPELWKILLSSRNPILIEIIINEKTIVSPKLEVNTPIEDLSPKLDPEELKKIMIADKD